jgi:hypothetical protein
MCRYLKTCLLPVLCFLLLPYKSQAQVEFSGLAGPAFNYSSVRHLPDSAGASPERSKSSAGYGLTLEASLPMQYGFRLKAGVRLLYKILFFEQDYNFSGFTIKNQWAVDGYSLETPVHLTYPVVDRRFQVRIGAGVAAVKNWIKYDGASISGSANSATGTTSSSFDAEFVISQYQPNKNNLYLAGELTTEIIFYSFPRFSIDILWHKDLLKELGQIAYENKYIYLTNSSQPAFSRSKGSFGIERPGYFMVQLKYTFIGKPKGKEHESKPDFEDDGS